MNFSRGAATRERFGAAAAAARVEQHVVLLLLIITGSWLTIGAGSTLAGGATTIFGQRTLAVMLPPHLATGAHLMLVMVVAVMMMMVVLVVVVCVGVVVPPVAVMIVMGTAMIMMMMVVVVMSMFPGRGLIRSWRRLFEGRHAILAPLVPRCTRPLSTRPSRFGTRCPGNLAFWAAIELLAVRSRRNHVLWIAELATSASVVLAVLAGLRDGRTLFNLLHRATAASRQRRRRPADVMATRTLAGSFCAVITKLLLLLLSADLSVRLAGAAAAITNQAPLDGSRRWRWSRIGRRRCRLRHRRTTISGSSLLTASCFQKLLLLLSLARCWPIISNRWRPR